MLTFENSSPRISGHCTDSAAFPDSTKLLNHGSKAGSDSTILLLGKHLRVGGLTPVSRWRLSSFSPSRQWQDSAILGGSKAPYQHGDSLGLPAPDGFPLASPVLQQGHVTWRTAAKPGCCLLLSFGQGRSLGSRPLKTSGPGIHLPRFCCTQRISTSRRIISL